MKKRIRINGATIFFVLLAVILFPRAFLYLERKSSWQVLVDVGGIALILMGQLLRVSARGYKSEQSKNGHALIKDGPYALVRNPMYLGILLIGLGIVLSLFRGWVVLFFLAVFLIRYIALIFQEEKKLLEVFSKEYPIYQKQVPRLLPRGGAFFNKGISIFLPLKFSWLKRELSSILWVLLATLLAKSWIGIVYQGRDYYLRESVALFCVVLSFAGVAFYMIRQTATKK